MSRYAARAALRALLPSLVLAACRESAGRLPTTAEPALARASADAASSTPRDPGRPVEVPAESVEAEIAAARREAAAHHHRGAAAASEAIRAFDLALTSRALHDLAFTALFDLREQRGADARTLRQHLARAYNRAATGVHHAPALGFASGDPCLVSFDQPRRGSSKEMK